MLFKGNEAFIHSSKISIPRLAGSDGEKEAAAYIKKKLQETGWGIKEEEFFIPLTPFLLFKLLLGIILLFVLFSRLYVSSFPLFTCFLMIFSAIFLIFSLKIWLLILHSDFYHQKTSGIKSKNIVASLNDEKDFWKRKLFLVAHYDSKSQNLSLPFRSIAGIFLIIFLFSTGFFFFLYSINPETVLLGRIRIFSLINLLTILNVILLLLLLFDRIENRSTGALDNASGVGVLLELAEILIKNPLKSFSTTLLLTGAEELGLIGASSFLHRHQKELSKEDIFLNVDSASDKNIMISMNKKKEKELFFLIKEAAKESDIKVRFFPFLPGFLMDHLSFSLKGYKTASLYTASKKSRYIHTSKDTPNLLEKSSLKNIGQLLERIMKGLDADKIPVRVVSHSGYRGEESPRSFTVGDKTYDIKTIVSATKEEDLKRCVTRRFLVTTKTGRKNTLLYDESSGEWFLLY